MKNQLGREEVMSTIQIQQNYRNNSSDYTIRFTSASITFSGGKYRASIMFQVVDTATPTKILENVAIEVLDTEWNAFWAAVKANGIKALFQTLKTKIADLVPGTVGSVNESN